MRKIEGKYRYIQFSQNYMKKYFPFNTFNTYTCPFHVAFGGRNKYLFTCNLISLKLPLVYFLELDSAQARHEVFKNIQSLKYFHCAISYISLSFIMLSAHYRCSHHQIPTVCPDSSKKKRKQI